MLFVQSWPVLLAILFRLQLVYGGQYLLYGNNNYQYGDNNRPVFSHTNIPPMPITPCKKCEPIIQYQECKSNSILHFEGIGIKTVGDFFVKSKEIKELYLDDNEITKISIKAFDSLTKLNILSLSNNNISIDKMLWFNQHDNLRDLIINNNKYNGTDTVIDKIFHPLPKLERLSLKNNGISNLNISLKNFAPSLRSLDLSGNNMKSIDFIVNLPETISYLNLHNNSFSSIKKNYLHNIENLKLSNNKITELCSINCKQYSFLSLEGMRKLLNLNVSGNYIKTVTENAFRYTTNLVSLDLSRNEIESLPENIFRGLESLLELRMSHNRLISIPNICALHSVRNVDLSHNRIVEINSDSFCFTTFIETLDLSNNHILNINNNFDKLQTLQKLDLSNNFINKLPIMLIQRTQFLEILLLKNNSITNIDELLTLQLRTLREIHLEENPFLFLRLNNSMIHIKEYREMKNCDIEIAEILKKHVASIEEDDSSNNESNESNEIY